MRGYILCFLSVGLLVVSLMGGCAQEKPEPPRPEDVKKKDLMSIKEPPAPPVRKQPNLPYPRGGRLQFTEGENGGEEIKEHVGNERVKAQVGVGVKGRSLESEGQVKMIVTPAIALFRTQERLVFEVEIPKNMSLFEATNGRKPNSQEEFMKQIIEANGVKLPELPAGQRYVYDPKAGELMVERPAQ